MTIPTTFHIVIPIYDDWESARLLLPLIGDQLRNANLYADVLFVDDGSNHAPRSPWKCSIDNIHKIRILTLRRNLGHQRAICIALCHLLNSGDHGLVMVMDGDGEDDPADIPRLIAEMERNRAVRIVFAERIKRSEGWFFSLLYSAYRMLHRLLVGHRVRVGNFSVMNRGCLEGLCASPELWNHYAASAFATRQPMSMVPTKRSLRLTGGSKMNFSNLVMHGLSALSVFSDRIGTRLLIFSIFAVVVSAGGMGAVTFIRLSTGYAIPGWATTAFGILLLLLVQIVTFIFTFCFLVLFARGMSPFIPIRDYRHFVLRVEEVWHGVESRHRSPA